MEAAGQTSQQVQHNAVPEVRVTQHGWRLAADEAELPQAI